VRHPFLCSAIVALAFASPHRAAWLSSASAQSQDPAGAPGPADAAPASAQQQQAAGTPAPDDTAAALQPSQDAAMGPADAAPAQPQDLAGASAQPDTASTPEAAPEPAADPEAEPKTDQKPDQKSEKKKKDENPVRIKGRVLFRNTVTYDSWANNFELASARLGAVYRNRDYGLRIEAEAELSGSNAEVRDAYVRLDASDHVRVQAGRFKRPISAISLTSRMDLPVVERGYLNDLEIDNGATREPDQLPLGGRFLGVTTTLRDSALPGQPELIIGVFRSLVHAQVAGASFGDRTPIGWSGQFPEDVFTRLELEPVLGLKLGASLAWVGQLDTAGDRSTFRHGFVSGLDAVVERGPFRGWLEAFVGASPLHLSIEDANPVARGLFQAARAIASARVPATATIYLEPYAAFQILNSSNELGNDRIMQGGGGINVGVGDGWRVQTAVDRVSVDSNPLLLYESATLFIVQLGAAF
jgi:hypothetical protein